MRKNALVFSLLALVLPWLIVPLKILLASNVNPAAYLFLMSLLIIYFCSRMGFKFTFLAIISSLTIAILFLGYNPFSSNLKVQSELVAFLLATVAGSVIIDSLSNATQINTFKSEVRRLTSQNAELQNSLEAARKEIKSRDEFLSIASHELRTPLTSMLLQLQTILHNIRNVSLANFSVSSLLTMLESAEQQTNRLSRLINDLLNVSLITTGKLELEKENIDLTKVTSDVLERFSTKLKADNIPLTFESEKSVMGNWDKLRLEQAISNLITNAIKYGSKKPLLVRVYNSHGTGKVAITDQGIGIPKSEQQKIFSLFKRAANSQDYQGLGVGLYITQQIVTAHGGKINLDSKPGSGSTFTIELPQK